MKTTQGMNLKVTQHARRQIAEKGFDPTAIAKTFLNPDEVYASRSHPGQYRVTGNGVCLVGKPEGNTFVLITVYADRVLTPPRPDQLDTPEGRAYAQRWAQGKGRGRD